MPLLYFHCSCPFGSPFSLTVYNYKPHLIAKVGPAIRVSRFNLKIALVQNRCYQPHPRFLPGSRSTPQ